MSTDNPFPAIPPSTPLSREELIRELLAVQQAGWEVFSSGEYFLIKLTDSERLSVLLHGAVCQIQPESTLDRKFVQSYARDMPELRATLARHLGPRPPNRTRFVAGQPASNLARIATLVGSAAIEAVHDPYLDDKGLDTLRTLFRLGVRTIPNLRLIKKDSSSNRLTEAFAKAFLSEFGCQTGEIRRSTAKNPHRRFMLLSGGQSLILGLSLNDLNKDEAAHLENDQVDRPFFEQEWNTSIPSVVLP